ncbi:MAG: hypothetical protein EOO01_30125, partial [Chitinophagaceae bacterium]
MIDQIHRGYLYHKDQYLVEVDFCFKYHPYLAQGLCLNMIIRPVPVVKNLEFLLLTEDGEIEGASKHLTRLLNLSSISSISTKSLISIKVLSTQLYKMNQAFNFMLDNRIDENILSQEKASEIYLDFVEDEQEIQISRYNKNSEASSSSKIKE